MLKNVINTIKDDNTIWIMTNEDNSDNVFSEYVSSKLTSHSYAIVSKDRIYIFVHKLDEANVTLLKDGEYKIYVYTTQKDLIDNFKKVIRELEYPHRLLFSYSTMGDENTDIIKFGCFENLNKIFRKIYKEGKQRFKRGSAEKNIYELISTYTDKQINRLDLLAKITNRILEESYNSIKVGETEIEIAKNTQNIAKEIINKEKGKLEIKDFDFAWDDCPIVLLGDNLEKGGHSLPSNIALKKGDTIYFDFGIKAIYEDEEILYTDIQRMGYVLKDSEKEVPENISNVFNTLIKSIDDGVKKMIPGIKAYIVDDIVRKEILKEYPNYPHATGHPVGKSVHGAGALISSKGSKRANLSLVENGIYTLEPRINIKNGGSIEEMIIVTKNRGVILGKKQEKLYLINK